MILLTSAAIARIVVILRAGRTGPPIPLDEWQRPELRTELLGPRLRRMVDAVAEESQTPPALAAFVALAVIAVACAKRFVIALRGGWSEPVCLYLLAFLAPGNRKSSTVQKLRAPLDQYERDENKRRARAINEDINRQKVLEQQLVRAQVKAGQAIGTDQTALLKEADRIAHELNALKVLPRLRLTAEDITPERMASLLAEQGERLGVISAEATLLETVSRYTSGAPNIDLLLKGHSGDSVTVDRMNRPSEVINEPALTLCIAAQPAVLVGLASRPGFMGKGLLQRFLYALPQSTVGRRRVHVPPVHVQVRDDWFHLVHALLRMPAKLDEHGDAQPYVLQLSADAQVLFDRFEADLEPRLGEFGDLGVVSEWASKLAGAVGRIAGLLHAVEQVDIGLPWDAPVSEDTMESAITLAQEFLIPHALAAFGQMGVDPVLEDARYLKRWLQANSIAITSKQKLFSATKGRFKTVRDIEPALAVLVEHGYLTEREPEAHLGPGRKRSPVYDVTLM